MKKLIIITCIVLSTTASVHAGWFDKEEQKRFQEVQKQLDAQRKSTGSWQVVAGLFAISSVLLFTIGTAIGSRVRRHEKDN